MSNEFGSKQILPLNMYSSSFIDYKCRKDNSSQAISPPAHPCCIEKKQNTNKLGMLLKIHFTQCFWVALTSLPPSLSFPRSLSPAQSVCVQRVFSRAEPACVAVGPAVRALPSRVSLPHPALWKLPLPRSYHQVGVNVITSPRRIQFSPWLCNVVYKWEILCRQETWEVTVPLGYWQT